MIVLTFFLLLFAGAVARCHQLGGMSQRIEGTSVCPPAFEDAVSKRSFFQIHVVDVGHLEFAAHRGSKSSNLLKNTFVKKINTRYRILRLRLRRFFFDAQYLPIDDLRAPKAV